MNNKVKRLLVAYAAALATAASGCASDPAANADVTRPTAEQELAPPATSVTAAESAPPMAEAEQANAVPANCYDLLAEMVRSSNFPFGGLDRKKVNLVIDEDAAGVVSAQVVFETDGSGVTGWVRYELATQSLFNTSAQLESPQRLRFDKKWADLFARCRTGGTGTGKASGETDKSSESSTKSSGNQPSALADAVRRSPLQPLPLAYDYDYVVDAPQFVSIADADLVALTGEKLSYGRVRRLPPVGKVQPILVMGTELSGEAPMFLVTLDAASKPVSRVLLYRFEEGDGGGTSTTFKIAPDYKTTVTRQATPGGAARKATSKTYRLAPDGKFIEAR